MAMGERLEDFDLALEAVEELGGEVASTHSLDCDELLRNLL